jgi:amidase
MQRFRFLISILSLGVLLNIQACLPEEKTVIPEWVPYDESLEIAANAENESVRLRYKLIQSQVSDKNVMLKAIENQLGSFGEEEYRELHSMVYEKDILSLQASVTAGKLSYENLAKWYLYRIAKFEGNRDTYLNGIIAINPNAVATAKTYDKERNDGFHPIYGIPVLLKDNVNFAGIPTTAGANVLMNNYTDNAFITDRIEEKGGIILGKTNLSEWANYLCIGCPNGYSNVGGQTLHPYGRKQMDTGGSSSGTGVAIAANYATVGVGTETSGSILSPSSSNSLVGLKPTVGLLSRGGIVPISSTLDTPGPMTRSVMDNAILLDAMTGEDPMDNYTKDNPKNKEYYQQLGNQTLGGMKFGVNPLFLTDSVYKANVARLEELGAETFEFEPAQVDFRSFGAILRGDMLVDLADYLKNYGSDQVAVKSVQDIVNYNLEDSTVRIPYGQGRFAGILTEEIQGEALDSLKAALNEAAVAFFEGPMQEFELDAILSLNNRGAGYAAAAHYPCITVPMGYDDSGKPQGLTFTGRKFTEDKLLKIAMAFEASTEVRIGPGLFDDQLP